MKHIKIICAGKLREAYWRDACAEYIKRLTPYCKLEIIEIKEFNEAVRLRIKGMYAAALCVEGGATSSEQLAGFIKKSHNNPLDLCFIIGGADGIPDDIKKSAQRRVSFSEMTFPHQMMRVILLEQIYRAYNIIEGGSYHK